MAKMFNLTPSQMKEIRRGILLAKNDHQRLSFEAKHRDLDEEIVEDMLEVYDRTEKLIIGHGNLTDLTVQAYVRTLEKLDDIVSQTDNQEME